MIARTHGPNTDEPARVLLAEDDDSIRDTLATTLREEGYTVAEVADGDELLDVVTRDADDEWKPLPYDVIVSDVVMPGFTALDVLVALRGRLVRTPVVLITAHRERDLLVRCKRAGAHSVLHKPFDLDQFCQVVGSALQHRSVPLAHPRHRARKP